MTEPRRCYNIQEAIEIKQTRKDEDKNEDNLNREESERDLEVRINKIV